MTKECPFMLKTEYFKEGIAYGEGKKPGEREIRRCGSRDAHIIKKSFDDCYGADCAYCVNDKCVKVLKEMPK